MNSTPIDLINPQPISLDVKVDNINGDVNDNAVPDDFMDEQSRPDAIITPDMAAAILKIPFGVAAGFYGSFWELSKSETDLMKEPAAKLFSEWFGRWAGEYPEAYMLGMALIVATTPRIALTVQQSQQRKRASMQEGGGAIYDTTSGGADNI